MLSIIPVCNELSRSKIDLREVVFMLRKFIFRLNFFNKHFCHIIGFMTVLTLFSVKKWNRVTDKVI